MLRPGIPSVVIYTFRVVAARTKVAAFFPWPLLLLLLCIGRARHPGPARPFRPPGISVEFLNLGGWLSKVDWR